MDCRSWALSRRDRRDLSDRGRPQNSSKRCTHTGRTITGVLHYLIHAYDDPEHAQPGLKAARAYAKAAAAVPHALHMPSHIFTRSGYWHESAATNLRGWHVSEDDVKRAHESGAYRDFHNLSYLEYAYIPLGRYRDRQHTVDIIAAQYKAPPNKETAPDT